MLFAFYQIVSGFNVVADVVAFGHKHFATTRNMLPLLPNPAFVVGAHEHIIAPLFIAAIFRVGRPCNIGFASVMKLLFIAFFRAKRTMDV